MTKQVRTKLQNFVKRTKETSYYEGYEQGYSDGHEQGLIQDVMDE